MTQYPTEQTPAQNMAKTRSVFLIATVLAVAHFVAVAYYLYLLRSGVAQFYTLTIASFVLGVIASIAALLSRRGKPDIGIMITLGALAISYPFLATLVSGLGLAIGLALAFAGPIIAFQVFPHRSGWAMAIGTVISGLTAILVDVFGSTARPDLPGMIIQLVVASVLAIQGYFVAIRFRNFSLRTKIISGILLTEVISIGVLAYFAMARASQIVTSLSTKFESSVESQTEEQLTNIVQAESRRADLLFLTTQESLSRLADYRAQLEPQSAILGRGDYWDAETKLSALSDGQYGNPTTDIASAFIPNTIVVNEKLLAEMNTTAFLDFSAPGILKSQPNIVAVYYMSQLGYTTYYPNIGLSTLLPADFDSRQFPFYTVADPQNNPERGPRWTEPYQDPAGTGLIVTASAPVYASNGTFKGVIGIDMQLARISENISQIKIGETGFAFLVNDTGHILTMPPQGYALFGLQPEEVPVNETPKETILGHGPEELQRVTARMVADESGVAVVAIKGVDYYLSFTQVGTPDYNLGLIVPVSEMNEAIVASQEEIRNETAASVRTAVFILIGLLLAAIVLSLALGQVIAAPLTRLTQTAEQISAGDLSARAAVISQDETGTLARSFNHMADRLNETLAGLEQRVAERTKALATVAELGTTTATILETNKLLQSVVDLSKERFELYHSHIYLLDAEGKHLVLTAGAGEPGRQMVAQGHSIPVDREQSLVARAARERHGVTVNDVTEAPDFLPNPLLPDTRSEMAVPMIVGGDLVGVFDVQSEKVGRFTEADVSVQTTLAAQFATSIQNVRLFERAKTQAELEALANSIGQKIQRSTTVEDTLQIAAREVGLALGASRVKAHIQASRQAEINQESVK